MAWALARKADPALHQVRGAQASLAVSSLRVQEQWSLSWAITGPASWGERGRASRPHGTSGPRPPGDPGGASGTCSACPRWGGGAGGKHKGTSPHSPLPPHRHVGQERGAGAASPRWPQRSAASPGREQARGARQGRGAGPPAAAAAPAWEELFWGPSVAGPLPTAAPVPPAPGRGRAPLGSYTRVSARPGRSCCSSRGPSCAALGPASCREKGGYSGKEAGLRLPKTKGCQSVTTAG